MVEVGLGHTWGEKKSASKWLWRILVGGALLAFLALLILVGQRDRNWQYVELEANQQETVQLSGAHRVDFEGEGRLSFVDPEARFTLSDVARMDAGRAVFDLPENATGYIVETPSAQIVVQTEEARMVVLVEGDTTTVAVDFGAVSLAPADQPRSAVRVGEGETLRTIAETIVGR